MNAVPSNIRSLLDLFATTLAEVRFGDVDATTLTRLADEVEAAAEVTAAAEASLEIARASLHQRQETLLHNAQRALAYARVYAESDPPLTARLDAITLPRPVRRTRSETGTSEVPASLVESASFPLAGARRPRGRPRKIVDTEPMLAGLASASSDS